jgi:hypothetical protein
MPIWKKTMVKIGAKKVAAVVVKREKSTEKTVDSARRFQRGSRHESAEVLKVKAIGKLALTPMLWMPFLWTDPKLLFSPTRDNTPQPPPLSVMTPA